MSTAPSFFDKFVGFYNEHKFICNVAAGVGCAVIGSVAPISAPVAIVFGAATAIASAAFDDYADQKKNEITKAAAEASIAKSTTESTSPSKSKSTPIDQSPTTSPTAEHAWQDLVQQQHHNHNNRSRS